MPSWNEKPHVTPAINVNLKRCTWLDGGESREYHFSDLCNTTPLLIPCPIPRSVTFTVTEDRCRCTVPGNRPLHGGHWSDCKGSAVSIRVSCSISGKTWEESYVADAERAEGPRFLAPDDSYARLLAACRDRWALVKALVLGRTDLSALLTGPHAVELLAQRDAVYAAIADMRRAEKAAHAAFLALPMDLRKASIISKQCGPTAANPDDGGIDLPSAKIFALYVERLIEQVGVLP